MSLLLLWVVTGQLVMAGTGRLRVPTPANRTELSQSRGQGRSTVRPPVRVGPLPMLRQAEPKGWVWVTQTVDVARQVGNEQSMMTLDGEPLPSMLRRRVTLGLVLDNEGHIATRLIDVSPQNPPTAVTVRSMETRSVKASFIGMDLVSGICILKAEPSGLAPVKFYTPETLPLRMDIRLYGFNPQQRMTPNASSVYTNPRRNLYEGQISKAIGDIRYLKTSPIYYLTAPPLTAAQDGSLVLGPGNGVFGLAIYDNSGQGRHLVYPISRIRNLAGMIISSRQSLRYGWFGATGMDMKVGPPSPTYRASTENLGVRIVAVAPDSPADQAGLRPRDVVLSVNDRRITSYAQLATLLRQFPPESEITVRIRRGAETKMLRARLVPSPALEPEQQLLTFARQLEGMEEELNRLEASDPRRAGLLERLGKMRTFVSAITAPAPPEIRLRVFHGLETLPLTPQLMDYFGARQGLLVTAVTGTEWLGREIRAGDIIIRVGENEVTDITSLLNSLGGQGRPKGQSIDLTIIRHRVEERIRITP
ncbi:MAG: PDZ domain-containing protein [Acidobacteriota bacterium]